VAATVQSVSYPRRLCRVGEGMVAVMEIRSGHHVLPSATHRSGKPSTRSVASCHHYQASRMALDRGLNCRDEIVEMASGLDIGSGYESPPQSPLW